MSFLLNFQAKLNRIYVDQQQEQNTNTQLEIYVHWKLPLMFQLLTHLTLNLD